MYIYIHIDMCVYTYISTHIYICMYIYIYVCIHLYLNIYICKYIYICMYIYIYVHQYMIYSYEHQMSSMSKQWKTWSEMVWIVSWKNLEIYVSSTRGRVKTWHQGVQTPIIWLAVSTYLNKFPVTRNHHPIKTEHTWNHKSLNCIPIKLINQVVPIKLHNSLNNSV